MQLVQGILVQLSSSITPLDFLKENPLVESCVQESFVFGGFHRFSGEIGLDIVRSLESHAYVVGISPDLEIKADEIPKNGPRHISDFAAQKTTLP